MSARATDVASLRAVLDRATQARGNYEVIRAHRALIDALRRAIALAERPDVDERRYAMVHVAALQAVSFGSHGDGDIIIRDRALLGWALRQLQRLRRPDMELSAAGRAMIESFEGFRERAYRDPGGVLTVGYGHTGREVTTDTCVTRAEADALLDSDTANAVAAVNKLVTVALTQAQFDALVSFVFNVGAAQFKASTLLKKLNAEDYIGAHDQFARWDKQDGQVLPGLARRRALEAALFASPSP